MNGMSISLCFTNWNRTELLFKAFEQVIDSPLISEIVISDDCSHIGTLQQIYFKFKDVSKVKIFTNEKNMDCYFNKARSVERATNEWVCVLDSDNVFGPDYINRIENLIHAGLNPKTIYQPEWAKPHFDFRHLSGKLLNRSNIAQYMDNRSTDTMLNAMNYFVNRSEYLRIFDPHTNPVTSDSIYQNYRWLDAGNSIYVVPSLQYEHRVKKEDFGNEADSHYRVNNNRTPRNFHNDIINKLKQMR